MIFKKDSHWREGWLGTLGRAGLILLVVFLLLILSTFPFFSGEFSGIRPNFMLIAIYYWAITRPYTLPYLAVFAIGITLDLVADYPMGLSAAVLIAVQWVTHLQRKFLMGQTFIVIWAGFALISLAASLIQWLVFILFYANVMSVQGVLMSALLTAAIFPLFVPLFAGLNKILAEYTEEA